MSSAETTTQNGVNGSGELTAAQKLMQKHNPIVEEVPDESDLKHPAAPLVETHVLEDLDEPAPASEWPGGMSAKAAGKRKAEAPSEKKAPVIDMQDQKSFPGLAGTTKAPAPAGIWGGGKPGPAATNGAKNGVQTNGSSTPKSGVNTPPTASQTVPRGSLAGQIQAPLLVLQKQDVLPRNQMKKPLPDLIKDINKKLRTNLTMRTGENGVLEFREASNQKEAVKDQAVRELGNQICAKVRSIRPIRDKLLIHGADFLQNCDTTICQSAHHRKARFDHQGSARIDWRAYTNAKGRRHTPRH